MKSSPLIKKFFDKSFQNLNTSKIFYKYGNITFSYKNLKEFYYKFLNFFDNNPIERKKIVIISEKNYEMYSAIISVVLSKNIWIPINPKLPKNRIENILKVSKPDVLIFNNIKQAKELNIYKFLKKEKYFLQILQQ